MSYVAARREAEKERRRAEILDATERLYAKMGWDALTVEQVARSARLSRALVYVYFRDKEDLLLGIGERAMGLLRERFRAAVATQSEGLDQVAAIGRAYMGYAHEFPHYFDFLTRFQSRPTGTDAGSNENACQAAGDQAIAIIVRAIEAGIADRSIRANIGDPTLLAVTLWAFSHGVIQLAMVKANDLARFGVAIPQFSGNALELLRAMLQNTSPA
jgi:AcrR family transcriptional regulator